MVVWRDGKEVTLNATLGSCQTTRRSRFNQPHAGHRPRQPRWTGWALTLSPLTPEMREKYQLGDKQKGVVVTDVCANGTAAKQGLKPGDVIVEVQQSEVSTPADVQEHVDSVRKENRKSVLMLIQRADGMQWVPVPLAGVAPDSRGAEGLTALQPGVCLSEASMISKK